MKYNDIYINYFNKVVFVKNCMDYSFMNEIKGKREIDTNTQKTYFITTQEEIKKLPYYEKVIKELKVKKWT